MADRLREILPSKYDESNKVLSLAGTADIPLNGVTPNYNTEGFVKSLFMAIVAKIPEVRFGVEECVRDSVAAAEEFVTAAEGTMRGNMVNRC